jgi:type II secretory pathway component PulF
MNEKLDRALLKFSFGAKQRMRTYRKLLRFLGNSVPLPAALDIMYQHATLDGKKPKAAQARIIDAWRRGVRNGKPFGRAIQGWVPESDRIVIEGGESSGKLAVALEKAVLIAESTKTIRSTLIAGLGYPVLLIVVAITFLAMFGIMVVPSFEQILPRDRWTGIGAQMAVMSDFVNSWLIPTILLIFGLIAAAVFSLPRWTGKWRKRFDKYPPWSLYRLILGSGFLLTVSGMVKSGIPIPAILRMLLRDANPYYAERIGRTLHFVNNGFNLGDALHRTDFDFPDRDTVQDLRAYASMNRFDETLETLGEEWLEDSVVAIKGQTGVLRNVAFIVLGVTFGWIAIGIFSLQEQIASSL